MSRGPGRVQRAILGLIATPEAMAAFDHETEAYSGGPGPVGAPLDAVYHNLFGVPFRPTWNCARRTYYQPTRAQYGAVHRAVNILKSRGLIATYNRRVCPERLIVAPYAPFDNETKRYGCCGYCHSLTECAGRPPTDAESEAQGRAMASAMAILRRG